MTTAVPRCVICGEQCTLRCAFCPDGPTYCSNAHYKEHWSTHKPQCGEARASAVWNQRRLSAQSSASRNQASTVSNETPCTAPTRVVQAFKYSVVAYILEAHDAQPRFESIDCWTSALDGVQPSTTPELSAFFPRGRGAHILHYGATMSILSNPYHIFYCTPSFAQQIPPNAAIRALLSDMPRQTVAIWPGNVVVLKFADDTCNGYGDMGGSDVPNIRAHFATFGRQRWN